MQSSPQGTSKDIVGPIKTAGETDTDDEATIGRNTPPTGNEGSGALGGIGERGLDSHGHKR